MRFYKSKFNGIATVVIVAASISVGTSCVAKELFAVGTQFGRVFDKNQDGEFVGLSVDLLRAIAKQNGDTVRFEIFPWARAQAMVELGKADILIGPYKSPEREQRFNFSEHAFYQDQMVFYARANSGLTWNGNYASIKGKHVVAVNGWVYGSAFDRVRDELGVTNTDTLQQGLQMLSIGRIDLLATNRRNTEFLLSTLHLPSALIPLDTIIDVQNGYFAFPKSHEFDELRLHFNRAFGQLIENGEFAKMAKANEVHTP